VLFDCGGADGARSLSFKEDLVNVDVQLGTRVRVAHFPPYISKWNPIAHRLLSQVERRWHGEMLDNPETALRTVEHTTTQSVRVSPRIVDKVYDLARKCFDGFREIKNQFICHHLILWDRNYVTDANGFNRSDV